MDQYNLIPNAFTVYSDCYAKIGEIGYAMSDPDVQDSPRHAQLRNQLITTSSLFYTVTGLINLNDDGDAIIGINADAELVNSLLLNLKDACGLNEIRSFPTPFTTINYNNVNPGQSYPVGGVGAILQSNGLTYLPLEMGAPGEVLTASPTGLVWSSVVGNGIPSGGTTGQALLKTSNTSYNVAWYTLSPTSIGVSASVSELNILDGATISTAELNILTGVNTGSSLADQLAAKMSTSLANGSFFVGNGSGVATAVAPTGDVTFNNTGLFAIGTGVIVDADISNTAAISRSKLASGNQYRIIVNDNTGVMSEAPAVAANRVIVSNSNGVPVSSTISTTSLGFLDATSSIQTQLNARLEVTLTSPAQGAMLYYNGTAWVNFAVGTAGQVLTSTGSIPQWGSATANGIPSGGTTNQYLRKIDDTNYNTEWHTFELADVTDVETTVTEVNLLSGLTVSATTLNFVDISSSLTTLLNNKQTISLPQNAIWRGNASNQAEAYPAGTEGYVLTVVGGVPTWAVTTPPGNVSGVAPSVDNAIARWNGTAADSIQNSAVIIDDSGNVSAVTTLSSGQISVLNQAAVRLYETGSTNYVGIRAAGTMASDYTITLPAAAPASNTFLMYDGANYVWNAGGGAGTIGGTIAAGQVAFGDGPDSITGDSNLTFNVSDRILTTERVNYINTVTDPATTVTDGDLCYSSGRLDFFARINGEWANLTRPGRSNKNSTYTISESERNFITTVDTSGGAVTVQISVDLSDGWTQTFINTGTNAVNFTASGGMTLNAIATSCTTQWGWVTVTRKGSNTYYASGALGAGGGGGGTVTSVAMSVPSFLSVAGSPITTSGTLAVTLATQSANTVFAGPTVGGAAAPTFRALVSADIPDLSSTYVTSVTGTAGRIAITGTSTAPVVNIDTGYIGQATITTLGTITTGVWNGTDIAYANIADGTGLSVFGRSAISSGANADIVASTDNQVLRRSGTSIGFGSINLASSDGVTGILGVANGGSGTSTVFTTGSVIFAGSSGVYSQDNSNFFWDNTNKRLGVRTATPSGSLHIVGAANGTNNLITYASSTTTRFSMTEQGLSTWTASNAAASQAFIFNHAGNTFQDGLRVTSTDGGGGSVYIWGTTSSNAGITCPGAGTLTVGHRTNADTGDVTVQAGRILTLRTLNQGAGNGSVVISSSSQYGTTGKTFLSTSATWNNAGSAATLFDLVGTFNESTAVTATYKVLKITPVFNQSGSITAATAYGIIYEPALTGTTNTTHYGFVVTNATIRNGFGTSTPISTFHNAGSQAFKTTTSSAASLTLDKTATVYIFTGSSSTTWTLPSITSNTDLFYFIKNRGSANITLNSASANELYDTAATSSITITPGQAIMLSLDGTYFNVM